MQNIEFVKLREKQQKLQGVFKTVESQTNDVKNSIENLELKTSEPLVIPTSPTVIHRLLPESLVIPTSPTVMPVVQNINTPRTKQGLNTTTGPSGTTPKHLNTTFDKPTATPISPQELVFNTPSGSKIRQLVNKK
jgi:hypothetical protein